MSEYLSLFIFFVIVCILSCIIVFIPVLLAPKSIDTRKSTPYECGFLPFNTPNQNFSVRFYLIAMLFLVFDLEMLFIIPWALNFKHLTNVEIFSMMIFISILIVGFFYEIKRGALEWD